MNGIKINIVPLLNCFIVLQFRLFLSNLAMKQSNNQIFCYHDFMFLLDLFLPKFCLGCGFLGAYICLNCQQKLSYITRDSCLYCSRDSLYGLTHPGCKRENGIDGLISIFHYNNLLKAIIKSIKYRLATEVWKELCLIIDPGRINKLKVFGSVITEDFLLQPIPLHANKLKRRGFNQAKIIALFFNNFLKMKLTDSLVRVKDTAAQAQMKNNHERYKNMISAFAASGQNIKAKNIILVDDVLTTGSTLKEAARVLKIAGAKKVFVLTLAKG